MHSIAYPLPINRGILFTRFSNVASTKSIAILQSDAIPASTAVGSLSLWIPRSLSKMLRCDLQSVNPTCVADPAYSRTLILESTPLPYDIYTGIDNVSVIDPDEGFAAPPRVRISTTFHISAIRRAAPPRIADEDSMEI